MSQPQTQARFEAITQREQGLRRGLSSAQLSMIALAGAIGTGLFLGSGFAIGFAGPSVLVSYAIGAVIALLLMGCLAEMTVVHPVWSAFGAWAEHYIGHRAGFLVRYACWSCIVFAVGTEVTAVALYMRFWYPGVAGWVWIVGFSAVLIAVNAAIVRLFGVVEYSFSAVKVTAILLFLALGAWLVFSAHAGSVIHNYTAHGGFFPKGLWGTWTGVIVALFSFFSIKMIAVAAGEAADPRRAITQAFRVTIVRLVLFYLLTLALILAIVPWPALANNTVESPFVKVMATTRILHAAGVVNCILLIAALSAMNSQLYIVSLSHVAFRSSYLHDRAAITQRAHAVGAMIVVDLYQSAGIVPLDVTALGVDFAVGGSVKWLLSGPGSGFLYVRPDLIDTLRPAFTGWAAHAEPFAFAPAPIVFDRGIRRILNGTNGVPALYSARSGYEIVAEIGVEAVRAKSQRQTQRLNEQAHTLGFPVRTVADPNRRGGVVILDIPNGRAVTDELGRRNILVDFRPGAGIRIAPHFYTTDEEIDHTLANLCDITGQGA